MLVCDLCGKQINESKNTSGFYPKQRVHYMYSASAWQVKEIDMCYDCQLELTDELCKAEAYFYNHKINLMEAKNERS